uniref:Uncharacterized protein n=1 Tax=Aegilops tauschii TaxID=37682 RepID=R7WC98_AEGTA
MVISLLLNVESLKDSLEGMKQKVAKMLKLNKRIGLATTEDGSYIYVKDYILDILLNPHAPECQEIFHQLPPCPRGQGFITHRAHNFALEYFKPLIDHGYNNGISPDQQHWMFSECLETDYVIAGSQHLRPPTGSAPGHLWHRMSCPRSKNNHPGFERSEGFSGYSSTYYSRFKNGLGSTPPN